MRIKYIGCLFLMLYFSGLAQSQEQFFTRQGYVSFYSHTPVEDIKADNNQVLSIVDFSTGQIAITILMKSFTFEKALMQEHFNENYVESDKYPKANFTGTITNLEALKNGENGVAQISGQLTIKDATNPVIIESKVIIENDTITFLGKFIVTVADFNIKIPAIVRRNIAKEVEVSFNFVHHPYNQK
ncbi:MAG TPA: YceI family protein [Flavobacteriaceae bacterium]|nr:YceI family protein [Flavobacteriaceae bacterium]